MIMIFASFQWWRTRRGSWRSGVNSRSSWSRSSPTRRRWRRIWRRWCRTSKSWASMWVFNPWFFNHRFYGGLLSTKVASLPAAPGSNLDSTEIFSRYCLVGVQFWDQTHLVLCNGFYKCSWRWRPELSTTKKHFLCAVISSHLKKKGCSLWLP